MKSLWTRWHAPAIPDLGRLEQSVSLRPAWAFRWSSVSKPTTKTVTTPNQVQKRLFLKYRESLLMSVQDFFSDIDSHQNSLSCICFGHKHISFKSADVYKSGTLIPLAGDGVLYRDTLVSTFLLQWSDYSPLQWPNCPVSPQSTYRNNRPQKKKKKRNHVLWEKSRPNSWCQQKETLVSSEEIPLGCYNLKGNLAGKLQPRQHLCIC